MTLHDADTSSVARGPHLPEPLRPPTPGGISMRPAMIVLGLAVLILVVFVTIGILSSQSPTPVRHGSGPELRCPASRCRPSRPPAALSPIVALR